MKKIEAIIRSETLDTVISDLEKVGYSGITVYEVEGHGKQKGLSFQWRGTEYKKNLMPKLKLEIFSTEKDYKKIVETIIKSAITGQVGDGKIFVSTIDEAFQIRTGKEGEDVVA
jgi:nitrogen regulatory protein P-II 1